MPLDTPDPRPSEIIEQSKYHDQFLALTDSTHGRLEVGRWMLNAEWRYYGPLLEGHPDPLVLDLACGMGVHGLAWTERGARVVGMDFDQPLLAAARGKADQVATGGRMKWLSGNARRLPFAPNAFDVVFCNSLLEHVPQWREVLAEMSRVLKPGGVVIIYTTNKFCPFQQEVNHFPFYSWLPEWLKRRVMAWIMEHRRDLVNWTDFPAVNWFTYPGMKRSFREVGLEPLDRVDLMARRTSGGGKVLAARVLAGVPGLKWGYYFYSLSMALYGIKRPN